ncbi:MULTISPECIES: sugar phosphate isomerase/epimerase [unclassified Mycolicibacterium]|uniref:sugar phosphate isomerase/epimerase family protein n=1 Tax=unclassified Mycolicibacterium TaxID=2636767 RepID=UPI00139107B3|nr:MULTISPECIES: sugar phosphate isomerase/epimerase family protein [unclassified Mycolicibacterium]
MALDSVVEKWAPERAIELLAGLGFEAVDWSFVQFDRLQQSAKAFRKLVQQSRDAGLEVPQLVLADDLITLDPHLWKQRVEYAIRAIDAAAEAGVATVGVSTGPHGWNEAAARVGVDIDESAAWDLAVTGVARMVDHAKMSDVRIGLESVWGSIADSGESTQKMLDAIPDLGITFDPSHLVLPGDDIATWAHQWRDRIVHVHLKDAFGRRGVFNEDFLFPILGEGQVPWKRLLTTLNDDGYQGCASIEAESYTLLDQCFQSDPTEPARLSLQLANRLYDLAGL